MTDIEELLQQKAKLDTELEQAFLEEQAVVIDEIKRKMIEYKISLEEVLGRNELKQIQAKYRDPETGAVWTGRGRAPHWIKDKNREDFLIVSNRKLQ